MGSIKGSGESRHSSTYTSSLGLCHQPSFPRSQDRVSPLQSFRSLNSSPLCPHCVVQPSFSLLSSVLHAILENLLSYHMVMSQYLVSHPHVNSFWGEADSQSQSFPALLAQYTDQRRKPFSTQMAPQCLKSLAVLCFQRAEWASHITQVERRHAPQIIEWHLPSLNQRQCISSARSTNQRVLNTNACV